MVTPVPGGLLRNQTLDETSDEDWEETKKMLEESEKKREGARLHREMTLGANYGGSSSSSTDQQGGQ